MDKNESRGSLKGLSVGGRISFPRAQCGPARAWQEGVFLFQPINMFELSPESSKRGDKNQRLCKKIGNGKEDKRGWVWVWAWALGVGGVVVGERKDQRSSCVS